MKKKVVIAVIVILVIGLLVCGSVMLLNKEKDLANSQTSGDVSGELNVNESNEDVPVKGDIDYVDPVDDYVLNGLLQKESLNVYAAMQEIKLEEVEAREYFWTMTGEGLENIAIDSDETEFVTLEYGVGEIVNRIYRITGIKEGEAILRFNSTYRIGEELVQSETIIYKISVNADKQVAITDEIRFMPTPQ